VSGTPSARREPGFYRYKVGTIEITVVTDGVNRLTDEFVLNAKKEEVEVRHQSRDRQVARPGDPVACAGDRRRGVAGRDGAICRAEIAAATASASSPPPSLLRPLTEYEAAIGGSF